MSVLVRGDGTPYVRPEKPSADASTEERVVYLWALARYNDAIANDANRAFAEQLAKSLKD